MDYGLVDRYLQPDGSHREDKEDRKRANNGTVEYRSRDAHVGKVCRRSDFECLAYNLIEWLDGTLPWMSCLSDAGKVEEKKKHLMANINQSLPQCFDKTVPKGLKEFFLEVSQMSYDSEPDYHRLKQLLSGKAVKRRSSRGTGDSDVSPKDNSSPLKRNRKRKTTPKEKEKTSTKRQKQNQNEGNECKEKLSVVETPAMKAIREGMAKKKEKKSKKNRKDK